jgi:deoxyadenosine/deoxycytidine kinase
MKQWSFHSQLFFLTQNFKAHLEIDQFQNFCIKDRTIYEDSEVFAANLFKQGFMSQRDYVCYQDIYQAMISTLKYPDLIIYLKASPAVLSDRIQKRERSFEKKINETYLLQINLAYDEWIKKTSAKTNVLTVDTDHFNVFDDCEKLEQIYQSIEKFMKELNVISRK